MRSTSPSKAMPNLFLVCARGDLGVGVGVNVRVHAHGDGRDFFQAGGHAADAREFRFAFHIEGINAAAEREFNLPLGLADAGEDAFSRIAARRHGAAQLALADDVESAAEIRQGAQHSLVLSSPSWRSKSNGPGAPVRGPVSDNAPSAFVANKQRAACRISGPEFPPAPLRNSAFHQHNENNASVILCQIRPGVQSSKFDAALSGGQRRRTDHFFQIFR